MATEHGAITTALRGESLGESPVNLTGALYLIGAPLLVLFLHYAEAVLVPIVLAVLIGYALEPLVTKLGHWRVPRAGAAMLVIVAVLAGLGGAMYHLRHHVAVVLENLPETARKLRYTVENELDDPQSSSALDKIKETASEIQKTADAAAGPAGAGDGVTRVEVQQPRIRVGDYLWTGSVNFAGIATQVGVVVFLVFFLLASGDLYRRKLVRLVGGNFAKKRVTVETLYEIDPAD